MALDQKDVELLERIIYKNGDDIAVSVARSFERLEERIDSTESRLYARFADLEDKADLLLNRSGEILRDIRGLKEEE